MLDSVAYRQAESLAKQQLNNWLIMKAHRPHAFAANGFPIQIDTIGELSMLTDIAPEFRFEAYMNEIGGLSASDVEILMNVLADFVKFFARTFRHGSIPLPLSSMVAHLALYKKICAYKKYSRILEVGPGTGYLSCFLAADKNLKQYHQVESTESLYLYQSFLNGFLFGEYFRDHAAPCAAGEDGYGSIDNLPQHMHSNPYEVAAQAQRFEYTPKLKCEHFPWWKIGKVNNFKYDVITSNANLNEFSEAAFRTYVDLFKRCLVDDGIILCQCLGGGPLSVELILNIFLQKRFAILFLVPQGKVRDTVFTVHNLVLVGEKHPLFSTAYTSDLNIPVIPKSVPWIEEMFFSNASGRRLWSRGEIRDELGRRIASSSQMAD
jgi:hypothetical protein